MTSSVRQIVFHDPGAPGFAAYIQTSFASATLAGSTLLIFGSVANYAGTTCQTAQNTGGGSPAPTGDATNGTYTALQLAHDPGNEAYGLWVFPNAAAVSAGTLFTCNYTAGDDYIGITIVEVTGVATASVIASLAHMTQNVTGAGTDNITSGTAVLGSSACITIAMSADGVNSSGPTHGTGFTDLGSGWGWGTGTNDVRFESQNYPTGGTKASTFDATYASTFETLMVALLDSSGSTTAITAAASSGSAATASLTGKGALVSSGSSGSSARGTLGGSGALLASASSGSLATASLGIFTSGAITATGSSGTSATALLTGTGALLAAASSGTAAQGVWSAGGVLAAAASSGSSANGFLGGTVPLVGAASSGTSATASWTGSAGQLVAAASSGSSAIATLSAAGTISNIAAAASSGTSSRASLTIYTAPVGVPPQINMGVTFGLGLSRMGSSL